MKKLIKAAVAVVMALAMTACSSTASSAPASSAGSAEETSAYTAGTYTGVGQGKMGDITVEVTVSDTEITDIQVVSSNESSGLGDVAAATVIDEVLANQSLDVDQVTGATLSRMGVLAAVKDALTQAGADVAALAKVPAVKKTGTAQTIDTDVVVIGSGGAGMTAALEAAYAGAKVTVLEKMSYIGGSTRLSSAMLVVGGSKLQEEAGIEDSVDNLKAYWMERGEGGVNEEWVNYVAENVNDAMEWFINLGVNYSSQLILQSGTATINRAHMPFESGRELMDRLVEEAEKNNVEILTDTTATELIIDENGTVTGVVADNLGETVTVNAKSVVIATGGFAASQEKLGQYSPKAVGSLYVGAVGCTGDGIDLGLSAGADTVFKGGYIGWKAVTIAYDHTHPIGAPVYGAQNLIVDSKGNRVGNEVLDYPFVYEAQVANGDDTFYAIFQTENGETVDLVGNQSSTIPNLELGVEAGVCYKADTLAELAAVSGMENIEATVATFNAAAEAGEDKEFGRDASTMEPVVSGPFYALQWKKGLLGTFGGLKTNLSGEVLSTEGTAISGLYAAGEVANGEFFNQLYPASGSAMDVVVVLGREAGKAAAANAK